MVEYNKEINEVKVFCDRCSSELTDELVSCQQGDIVCKECFDKEHKIISVNEYIAGLNWSI